ncbi:MAG TPA: hypothetical protein VNT52_03150, partial [Acidimicrobiales bacterium]|nr:hypothetical protein [Acidimicrobiales bacterium]
GGIAVAQIPDSSGVIHACRNEASGTVRVINAAAGESCTPREIPLSWNHQGVPGPAGPAGPAGAGAGAGASAEVYFASMPPGPIGLSLTVSAQFTSVISKAVPAGNYKVEARATVLDHFAEPSIAVECRVPGAFNLVSIGAHTPNMQLELTSAFAHTGGTVDLMCRGAIGDLQQTILVQAATMLITKVDTVG